ncbi:diguanylate cyclase [Paenalkalicoccus suaedae]|uniref:Diguanylate cyclase n=1 Tax=Paenalkalicoccus suaedae TaxID=2592382 RepID=A0A859FC24_9BACI|nr:sensor domain-containing diguanylate cyclase [Paenalkalicoccus suaedae]QKS70378.1 diguanylate cyclase [Paenalkalicoccus suaedae]
MEANLNFAPCGYLELDLDGIIIDLNQTLLEWIGLDRKQIVDRHFHMVLTNISRVYFQTYFPPMLSINRKVNEMYLTINGKNAMKIPVLVNAEVHDDRIMCVMLQMKTRDVYENNLLQDKRKIEKDMKDRKTAYEELENIVKQTKEKQEELAKLNEELQRLATIDPLTGLYNRRFMQERLEEMLHRAIVDHVPFSIILLDIDFFKRINDEFGHQIGDEVLQELSQVLSEFANSTRIVGRMGGEEFIFVLPSTNGHRAYEFAQHFTEFLEIRNWATKPIYVSGGVSSFEEGDTLSDLLLRADEALYFSKNNGRRQVTFRGRELSS